MNNEAPCFGRIEDPTQEELDVLEGRARFDPTRKVGENLPPGSRTILDFPWLPTPQLTIRAFNALRRFGITRMEQFDEIPDRDLVHIHGLGPKGIRELRQARALLNIEVSTPRVAS